MKIIKNYDAKLPPNFPSLLQVYKEWSSYHFDTYTQSAAINKVGAIGRNRFGVVIGKDTNGNDVVNNYNSYGYISVVHQRSTSKYMVRGLVLQDITQVEIALLAIEYVYQLLDYQGRHSSAPLTTELGNTSPRNEGRFLVIPTPISSSNILEEAGAISFFANDLGESLLLASQSSWFQASSECREVRRRLKYLLPLIEVSINWLLQLHPGDSQGRTRSKILSDNDRKTPNRKLVQALGLYQMSLVFNRNDFKNRAIELILDALRYQVWNYETATLAGNNFFSVTDITSGNFPYLCYSRAVSYLKSAPLGYGYFSEDGGSGTSYNATNLVQLIKLFCLLPESEIKQRVWYSFLQALKWQVSRILPTGEISSQDNTRVGVGGETYFGKNKSINHLETLISMAFFYVLKNDSYTKNLTTKMLDYYTT